MFIAKDYEDNLKEFNRADTTKALILYGIFITVLCAQGIIYTTNLNAGMITGLNFIFPLAQLLICLIFIFFSKQKLRTIGLTGKKLIFSLILGIGAAALLLTVIILHAVIIKHSSISLHMPSLTVLSIFAIGAIQEEIIFRGYIQTRLSGSIKNLLTASCVTGFLFLFIHYPVHWIAGGFSLSVLSAFYVLILLILHFACDFVYKKTNCLWGAIMLHFLYNAGQAILII